MMGDVVSPEEPAGRGSFDARLDDYLARLPELPRADETDLAQMHAALAAEGYFWVHPLDGSPKRLEKVARPADDVRAILEGAARGRVATTLMGEAGPEALEPLVSELRALRLDMDALREAALSPKRDAEGDD